MGNPGFAVSDPPRGSQYATDRRTNLLRRTLLSLAFVVLYVALDRFTTAFADGPAASAWYPPAGLAFAFLLTFGASYIPVSFLAELLTYLLTWKLQVRPLPIFALAAIPPLCYGSAAAVLRRSQWMDLRLRNPSAVARFLLAATLVPLLAGLAASAWVAANGLVPWHSFPAYLFRRSVGDALGIVMLTPLLLVYGLPWLQARMDGQPAGQNLTAGKWQYIRELTAGSATELLLWAGTTVLALWWAYSPVQGNSENHYFYPLFVPLVWIAIRHGLPGAMVAVLTLNIAGAFSFGVPPAFG